MLPGADLTNLFVDPAPAQPWRQGVVLAWNSTTGANTIDVEGVALTNLPLLNIGDTINLTVGNVVVLAKFRSSWAILGRIIPAGSAALNATATVTYHGQNQDTNFATSTSFATHGTFTFTTPSWANQVLIYGMGLVTANNSTAVTDTLRVILDINGAGGGETLQDIVNGRSGTVTVTNSRQMGVTGGQTIQLDIRVRTNTAGWAASAANAATLNSFALFTKV